jgi:hypothetical protein
LNTAVLVGAIKLFSAPPVAQLGIFTLSSWLAVAIARRGWPAFWRVLLAYGLAARIPVLVVMFLAIFLGWDTHYTKPRPSVLGTDVAGAACCSGSTEGPP